MKFILKLFYMIFIGGLSISSAALADNSDNIKIGSGQYLYTVSNSSSGNNSVIGYKINPSNGSLKELPGSPFPTRGNGEGVILLGASDNGLTISKDHKFLFAPNRGSQTIAVFRIHNDGLLTHVPGSPFPTGGYTPVSLALHGDLLYVSHLGLNLPDNCSGCEYRGYRVSKSGAITPMADSVYKLSVTPPAIPLALRFSPNGQFLIGTEAGATSKINVFEVKRSSPNADAELVLVPGSPFDSIGKDPFGFNFNPANDSQFFVSNLETTAVPGNVEGSVSSYLIAKTGQISPIVRDLPSNGGQEATCWISLTNDGKLLFATNPTSDSVTSYNVTPDGRLTLQHITKMPRGTITRGGPLAPVDMAITTHNDYLYMATVRIPTITGFKISADGGLTLIPGVSPLQVTNPVDAAPFGIAYLDFGAEAENVEYADD